MKYERKNDISSLLILCCYFLLHNSYFFVPKEKTVQMKTLFAALVFSVMLSGTVFANEFDSCRCKNGLATVGDTKDEVLQDCGVPVSKRHTYKTVRGNRRYVEEWIYNFGPNEFMQAINFSSEGKVLSVTSLGYGS